jgi:hypothetical protein
VESTSGVNEKIHQCIVSDSDEYSGCMSDIPHRLFDIVPAPKLYTKSGQTVQDIMRFIVNEGSFMQVNGEAPLSIASMNQLAMLIEFEDSQNELYESIYKQQMRNHHFSNVIRGADRGILSEINPTKEKTNRLHLRPAYESSLLDGLFGEVIFDGKRWHVCGFMFLIVVTLLSCGCCVHMWRSRQVTAAISSSRTPAPLGASTNKKKKANKPSTPSKKEKAATTLSINATNSNNLRSLISVETQTEQTEDPDDISGAVEEEPPALSTVANGHISNGRQDLGLNRCTSNDNVPALVLRTKRIPTAATATTTGGAGTIRRQSTNNQE